MDRGVLDRELILDLMVNIVPLALILLFAVGAVLVAPLGRGSVPIQLGELFLLAVPFVVLAVVTYLAGRAVALDERSADPDELPPGIVSSRAATPDGVGEVPGNEGETTTVDGGAEADEVAAESGSEGDAVAGGDGAEPDATEPDEAEEDEPVPETERETGTESEA